MKKVVVIGGGAAGMMAAISAADAGADVLLLEKNEKLGKKLYITGKGRCNFTNSCDREDFFKAVVSNPRFLYSSFNSFDNHAFVKWIEREGLPVKLERGGRYFPKSDKSSDVIKILHNSLIRRHVKIMLNTAVRDLVTTEYRDMTEGTEDTHSPSARDGMKISCKGVRLATGEVIACDAVIVATGGLSYPSTGSTGDGYRWAEKNGIIVKSCRPSLVGYKAVFSDGSTTRDLAGLSLKNVGVRIKKGKKSFDMGCGEMLFTHVGVSGPLVLTGSCHVPLGQGETATLIIDWKPALTIEQVDARLLREFDGHKNMSLKNVMTTMLPSAVIKYVMKEAGIPIDAAVHSVTRQERSRLAETLKAFPLTLNGLCGYNEAVITQGGVSVKELNPATMESKKISGLYFAGEIIDLDAVTGGFNLQIAWTTGRAAGLAAGS
ncbi:MAG: aminoacetone oxidase family FAD-binding enzyme [Lachnospiraceae bacterium]|nr:aminoacetone oxidase family FAD-binding enzyme [Lachnospiraceae bacterium]